MLFVVFAFTALIFGAYLSDSIYFDPGEIDENGVLTIDIGNSTSLDDFQLSGEKKITDYEPLKKENPDNFYLVAENEIEFKKLRTSATPDILSYPQCSGVGAAHADGIYGLLGFTVKAVNKQDILPSIPYLFKSAPTKVHYVKNGEDLSEADKAIFTDADITQTCTLVDLAFSSYSIVRGGIVDESCVPNTVLPSDAFKCSVDGAKYKTYLKGYKVGHFFGVSAENLKKLVVRFGVVDIPLLGHVIGYEKKDEKNYWIFADWKYDGFDYKKEEINTSDTFYGKVIGNKVSALKVTLSVVLSAVALPMLALLW